MDPHQPKKSGFNKAELVKVYTTIIRPVLDYGCVVYHSSLTDEQDEALERLQDHALKCIFGPGASARSLRREAGISTLRDRRIEVADKFADKLVTHPRFEEVFPLKEARASRRGTPETYLEYQARCDRLKNSPFHYYRRRLNGKPGKNYGIRNSEYRS